MTAGGFTLRNYQTAQLQAVVDGRKSGLTRMLVKSPTGTGKTVTFAAMPSFPHLVPGSLSGVACKMLVIAHREELLDQSVDKIRRTHPELRVDVEQGDRVASRFADVVVASVQTLAAVKYRRLKRLLAHHGVFNLVIIDEAHHSAARTYRGCLAHLGFLPKADTDAATEQETEAASFDDVAVMEEALRGWDERAPKDRILVGVTATPNRSDSVGLNCVFQSLVYSYALRQAIADGWLVPIEPWAIETSSNLDNVRIRAGEFVQSELADAVNNDPRNALALAAWREHAEGKSTIAFSVDVAHAHAIADVFDRGGVRAVALSGETDKTLRRQYLEAYTRGDITVIANCMVLTEGTDLPRTECILHCKPTQSATLYEQMTGRGLRIHPGKSKCVVIDLVDIARRHSLQAAPVLYGLPPSLIANGDQLDKFAEKVEAMLEAHPTMNLEAAGRKTLAQLNAIASTFDIWQLPSMGGYGTSMKWVNMNDGSFRLQYPWHEGGAEGTEVVRVEQDQLGQYEVSVFWRRHDPPMITAPRKIAKGFGSPHEALLAGERFVAVSRRSVQRIVDNNAPWRERPASDKQIRLLMKLRAPITKDITAGRASDLIDSWSARRGQR